ncbi:methyltransferase domain-containing protein [Nocardiopsis quinghaiensis]|uniref:methyltransferase domain-containing protein n=1 Tax=Nocardiopsis quinghaiensis TaxID=464995 RepID=UPI001239E62C|nr:methyltransferase domain-containing protein [Nocardiopsis quinghaiensis]
MRDDHPGASDSAPLSEETDAYYDISNQILRELWGENFHHGYWTSEEDDSSNQVATDRMTDELIARSGVGEGGRLLDVGCGVGLPALRLAERTGAHVVGVSNNEEQVFDARGRAEEAGMSDRVLFELGDGADLEFPDSSFDTVWAFESLMHMERGRALAEIVRVLRPGGRLVATDLLRAGPMSPADEELVRAHLEAMSAGPLLDLDGYRGLLVGSGLEVVELLDITPNTKRTPRRIIDAVDERHDELVERFGPQVAPLLEVFKAPVGLVEEFGYLLAHAVKPT